MKRSLEADATHLEQCMAACDSLLLVSRNWAHTVHSLSITEEEMRQFGASVGNAVTLLVEAMDTECYNYSFFLPAFQRVPDEFLFPNRIASVQRALKELEANDPQTVASHDLLTGRLMLCLLLGQYHCSEILVAQPRYHMADVLFAMVVPTLTLDYGATFLNFIAKLLGYFIRARSYGDDRLGRWGFLMTICALDKNIPPILLKTPQNLDIFDSVTSMLGDLARYDCTQGDAVELEMMMLPCSAVVTTIGLLRMHNVDFMNIIKGIFLRTPEFLEIMPAKTLGYLEVMVRQFFMSGFFPEIADGLLDCKEIVPILIREMKKNTCWPSFRVCDLLMHEFQMPFLLNPDLFYCFINVQISLLDLVDAKAITVSLADPRNKWFYSSFCRRECSYGKKSALAACYQSGASPSVYAFIALLISESKSISLTGLDDDLYPLRFLQHFQRALGEDICNNLIRKLREEVSRLASDINSSANEYSTIAGMANDTNWINEILDDYLWKLTKLRANLVCYTLLDDFMRGLHRKTDDLVTLKKVLQYPLKITLPRTVDNPMFNGFQSFFSDLLIEIYADSAGTAVVGGASDKKPVSSVKAHKLVVSWHSKYLFRMLTSSMREGAENTIRLVTCYPHSLRKLLLSFYDHSLDIASPEELVELLYLADEYDVTVTMQSLKRVFPPPVSDPSEPSTAAVIESQPSLEITLENASLFLSCSKKLHLKLEERIFAGLAQKWWLFGPPLERELDKEACVAKFATDEKNCLVLYESLMF